VPEQELKYYPLWQRRIHSFDATSWHMIYHSICTKYEIHIGDVAPTTRKQSFSWLVQEVCARRRDQGKCSSSCFRSDCFVSTRPCPLTSWCAYHSICLLCVHIDRLKLVGFAILNGNPVLCIDRKASWWGNPFKSEATGTRRNLCLLLIVVGFAFEE
jgi:hypothetical protein